MNRIVITGATGYIGKNIVMQAIERKCEVLCLVHGSSSRLGALPDHPLVRVVDCAMDQYAALEWSEEPCDAFFHLAWANTAGAGRDDAYSQTVNITHTIDALHLAKRMGCKVFVGAGSQAEYGKVAQGVSLSPDTPCFPSSGYGIAKHAAGKLGALTAKQMGISFNWIRILSIYGAGDSARSLISYAVQELTNNRKPQFTACEQVWDYLHVSDAAAAFLAIAHSGVDGKTYVLGSGKGRMLHQYIQDIYRLSGADCGIDFGVRPYYPHQPMYMVADIDELKADTGWNPKIEFAAGVEDLLTL